MFKTFRLGYLTGPTDVGRTSLTTALTNPTELMVTYVSLRSLTPNLLSLIGLIDKQINDYSKR